jgi:hypothetical protein
MPDGKPFRLDFIPIVGITHEQAMARVALAHERYPLAQRGEHKHPVAVVGGGPSLLDRLEELRGWLGDIWAINRTADWLQERGIDCTLLMIDPADIPSKSPKALLASACHPNVFEGKEVRIFDCGEHSEDGVIGGTTTAGRAPMLALKLGYPGVALFGCDSSFDTFDHVDRHETYPDVLMIRANGKDFKTYPELQMQAACLAEVVRELPMYAVNKSGGLLEAMVADPAWEVVAVSDNLKHALIDINGDSGIYDQPYVAQGQ